MFWHSRPNSTQPSETEKNVDPAWLNPSRRSTQSTDNSVKLIDNIKGQLISTNKLLHRSTVRAVYDDRRPECSIRRVSQSTNQISKPNFMTTVPDCMTSYSAIYYLTKRKAFALQRHLTFYLFSIAVLAKFTNFSYLGEFQRFLSITTNSSNLTISSRLTAWNVVCHTLQMRLSNYYHGKSYGKIRRGPLIGDLYPKTKSCLRPSM